MEAEERLKEEIVRTARVLYEKGLVTVFGGNISARVPQKKEFWITPSHVCKSELKTEDLVRMDLDGNVLEGNLEPSVEKLMHARVYRAREDANAIIHAHNPLVLALVHAGLWLEPVTIEADLLLGEPEVVPFLPPGSEELAEAVEEMARKGTRLIILEKHGVVGIGRSLLEARAIVELAEDVSKILLMSR